MGIETKTSFKKGESGNPNGRPKAYDSWKTLMAYATEESDNTGKSKKRIIVETLVELAKSGDLRAMEILMDRMEGKPKQVTENRDLTLEENPMYQQLKAITDKFKE